MEYTASYLSRLRWMSLTRGLALSTLLRLRNRGNVDIRPIQSLGAGTSVRVTNGGRIRILRGSHTRVNVTFLADGGELTIGSGCFFNSNCSITSLNLISIGDGCSFGPNVVIVDHDHDFRSDSDGFVSSPVLIGSRVWIGANVVILRGSVIGDGAVVGAGTVLKGSVPARHLCIQTRETLLRPLDPPPSSNDVR